MAYYDGIPTVNIFTGQVDLSEETFEKLVELWERMCDDMEYAVKRYLDEKSKGRMSHEDKMYLLREVRCAENPVFWLRRELVRRDSNLDAWLWNDFAYVHGE